VCDLRGCPDQNGGNVNLLAIPLVASVAVLAGCSSGDSEHQSDGWFGHQSSVSTTSSASAAAVPSSHSPDAVICKGTNGLAGRGKGFYRIVEPALTAGHDLPINLGATADAVRNLSKVGAAAGSDDGSAAIMEASVPVQFALLNMVAEARQAADYYDDVESGKQSADTGQGLGPLLESFTAAHTACREAGYQIDWGADDSDDSSSDSSNTPFRDSDEFKQYYDDANTKLDPCKEEFVANSACKFAIIDTIEVLRKMRSKLSSDYPDTKLELNKQIDKLELFANNCDGAKLSERADEGCPIMIIKGQLLGISAEWYTERRALGLK